MKTRLNLSEGGSNGGVGAEGSTKTRLNLSEGKFTGGAGGGVMGWGVGSK